MMYETVKRKDVVHTRNTGPTPNKNAVWTPVSEVDARELVRDRYSSEHLRYLQDQLQKGQLIELSWGYIRKRLPHNEEV